MLTPGIEYFGARDDEDAVAFAEGRPSPPRTIVRADHLDPEGVLALLGSLLTARPMSELSAPAAFAVLDVEARDDGAIEIFAVQPAITAALGDASAERFAEIARRLTVYVANLDEEAVVADLDRLAAALREGGGGLYGRRIRVPDTAPGRGAKALSLAYRAAGPAGLAMAALIFVLGVPLLGSVWWLPVGISGVIAGLSLGAIISSAQRDRTPQRIADLHPGGFVLSVPIDRGFFSRLRGLADVVELRTDARMTVETTAYLLVDPSGLTLFIGRQPVAFVPTALVTAVGATTMDADFGAQPEPAGAVALIILVATGPDEAEPWLVPLGFQDRYGEEESATVQMAQVVGNVLGVPAPGR